MDQNALIQSALKGNLHAYNLIIKQHQALVYSVVKQLIKNPPEDIEDQCQEVFITVYERLAQFKNESKLSTWIAQIAYNSTLNQLDKKRRRNFAFNNLEVEIEQPKTPEEELFKLERKEFLNAQIERLPDNYKLILKLYHQQELSLAEISNITNQPTGTIKNYLFRARKQLKEQLVRYQNRNKVLV